MDAIWIENLNTVLDDNKLLTLANGDRVPMTDNVRLLFEVENLRNASPATVSRAGIIFLSDTDLGWAPLIQAWLARRPRAEAERLQSLFSKYLDEAGALRWLRKHTKHSMPTSDQHLITNLLRILDGLLGEASAPFHDSVQS